MGAFLKIVRRILATAFSSVVAQATLIFMQNRGLDVSAMVAAMFEGAVSSGAAWWFLVGAGGLIGMFLFEMALARRKRPADAKATLHALPDLRALNSDAIKAMLANDDERRILVEKMRNGALTTWAHRKGLRDPQRLKPSAWENATLEYEIVAGDPVTNVLPHNEKRVRPWSNQPVEPTRAYWHDVYFNRAQLHEHWPDKF